MPDQSSLRVPELPQAQEGVGKNESGDKKTDTASAGRYSSAVNALSQLRDDANNKGRQVPIVCPGHSRPIAEVAYSPVTPDGSFLISACHDKQPMLREGKSGDWIGTFFGHKGAVWSAKLDSRAVLAATGAGDFTATIWNAVTGAEVQTMVHKHVVKTVDFSPDDRCLATGGNEGILRIFSLDRGAETPPQVFKHKAVSEGATTNGKAPFINKAVWRNTNTICTGANDGVVRLWDIRTKGLTPVQQLKLGSHTIMDIELQTNLDMLTVASGEHVHFYKASDLSLRKKIDMPVHFHQEGGASLHPSGKMFISGGGRHGGSTQGALGVVKDAVRVGELDSDLIVYVLDYETGEILERNKGHHGPVRCLRYHPDGMSYATGSEDGTIRLWETFPGGIGSGAKESQDESTENVPATEPH
jgi:serine-threonine kinase receptor-associated protein